MVTQAQTLTMVRQRLDEPTSTYWTDTDLRQWINEITSEVARRSESLRASFTQTVVAGTAAYSPNWTTGPVTDQPIRLYRCEFTPTGSNQTYPLEFRDRNAMDDVWGTLQNTEGTPCYWTSWGYPPAITLQLFPNPSLAGSLRIDYYRAARLLSTDTTDDAAVELDIPSGWDDVIVDGVEYKALRRDSDPRWTEAKQLFEQNIEGLSEAALRFTDAMPVITNANGGMVPAWLYAGDWDY